MCFFEDSYMVLAWVTAAHLLRSGHPLLQQHVLDPGLAGPLATGVFGETDVVFSRVFELVHLLVDDAQVAGQVHVVREQQAAFLRALERLVDVAQVSLELDRVPPDGCRLEALLRLLELGSGFVALSGLLQLLGERQHHDFGARVSLDGFCHLLLGLVDSAGPDQLFRESQEEAFGRLAGDARSLSECLEVGLPVFGPLVEEDEVVPELLTIGAVFECALEHELRAALVASLDGQLGVFEPHADFLLLLRVHLIDRLDDRFAGGETACLFALLSFVEPLIAFEDLLLLGGLQDSSRDYDAALVCVAVGFFQLRGVDPDGSFFALEVLVRLVHDFLRFFVRQQSREGEVEVEIVLGHPQLPARTRRRGPRSRWPLGRLRLCRSAPSRACPTAERTAGLF